MMKKIRGLLLLSLLLIIVGCGGERRTEADKEYKIYFPDRELNKMSYENWYSAISDEEHLIDAMLERMAESPTNLQLRETILGFSVERYDYDNSMLVLHLSEGYRDLDVYGEILTRAALVRTLTQIPGVDFVAIKIGDVDLLDSLGQNVGYMSADQFVDNEGNEINSMEYTKLTLYFARRDGKTLRKVTRTMVYNSNISLDKLVVEQLISGPTADSVFPTINPNTVVINITTKDGICYVNLSKEFLELPQGISSEASIYSIVDSLTNLVGINKVQISIDGSTDIVISDAVNLNSPIERNLDIIK